MARTIAEIQRDIILQVQGNPVLNAELTSTSKVAIWRLWTYVVAVCMWTIEKLQDLLRTEIDEKIAKLKPHTRRWYALKAVAFQYGFDLVKETDYYDNTGVDDSDVEASKIVDYAEVVEQTRGLRIKVAKDNGTDLEALTTDELDAFIVYMGRVKDAGVKLLITTAAPDSLKGQIDVYYNPLVLNAAGGRIDGISSNPVLEAFRVYLKNLPFNGVFALQNLIDVLQAVDGVRLIDIKDMRARYALLAYVGFRVQYIPDAGYLRIYVDVDMLLNFIPYVN